MASFAFTNINIWWWENTNLHPSGEKVAFNKIVFWWKKSRLVNLKLKIWDQVVVIRAENIISSGYKAYKKSWSDFKSHP